MRTRQLGFKRNRFPQLGKVYIRQPPEGLQAGALKPPDPVGIPWGRTQPADMSFCTSPQSHLGHLGFGALDEKTSSSKQWQQALH
jgi:hypothetical protein